MSSGKPYKYTCSYVGKSKWMLRSCKILDEKGANIKQADRVGNTALKFAEKFVGVSGYLDIAKLLREKGAKD